MWYTDGVHFEGELGEAKMRCYRVFWTSNLYFFIKENWIWAMTKDHVNNILLARNLPFDSDVRRWSHPLMTSLHCLWAKSSHKTRSQFECDMALFLFWFCSFTCTVRLRFHSLFAFPKCVNMCKGWLQNEF